VCDQRPCLCIVQKSDVLCRTRSSAEIGTYNDCDLACCARSVDRNGALHGHWLWRRSLLSLAGAPWEGSETVACRYLLHASCTHVLHEPRSERYIEGDFCLCCMQLLRCWKLVWLSVIGQNMLGELKWNESAGVFFSAKNLGAFFLNGRISQCL
jgi:hypothetical protein